MLAPASFAAVRLFHTESEAILYEREEDIPSLNIAKGDGVSTYSEASPFLSDRLRQASYGGLGGSIVSLSDISVQAGYGGNVHNRTVLFVPAL